MRPADQPEFTRIAEALFAAFDKPATEARIDAYWRGLKSMDLLAFESTVERIIGPQGEDELPTPKQLYAIDRKRRAQLRAEELAGRKRPDEAKPEPDRFECYTGRVLFCLLCSLIKQHGSAATAESLREMIHVKHNFAQKYREQCKDDPEVSLELRDHLIRELTPLFVPCEPSKAAAPRTDIVGEIWERAIEAVARSSEYGGHNAPPDSPQWQLR